MPGIPKRFVDSGKAVFLVKLLRHDHVPERFEIAAVIIFFRVFQSGLYQLMSDTRAAIFRNAVHFLQLANAVNSD